MIQFTVKAGTVVEASDFNLDNDHLIKFNARRDGETEGAWCYINPDDREDHDADVKDDKIRLVICANSLMCGIPWGAIIPCKLSGEQRPICDMNELIDLEVTPVLSKQIFELSAQKGIDEGEKPSGRFLEVHAEVLGEDHELVVKLKEMFSARGNIEEG